MTKQHFQDIRVSKKRKTERLLSKKKPVVGRAIKKTERSIPSNANKNRDGFSKKAEGVRNGTSKSIWVVAFVFVLFLLYTVFSLFAGATVNVVPKQEATVVDGVFSAYKNASDEQLQFDIMILAKEKSVEVPASVEKQMDRKASGDIVIYNTYSDAAQRLIKNTRFESTDGKIYRIKESTVVPGTEVKDGKIIPGSVEVKVYADEPGEYYNLGLSDFTIPGFKGSERFDNFYARSKTEISGGFSGLVKVPSEEDVLSARAQLRSDIESQLLNEASAQKPNDFVLYQDGIFITFDDDERILEAKGDSVEIIERGTFNGIIFSKQNLAKFIARQTSSSYEGDDVYIQDVEDISFNIENKDGDNFPVNHFLFTLSGPIKIVWTVDEDALKSELVNTSKKDFNKIMAGFFNIEKAEATIRPFWKRTFPAEEKNIRIEQII